MENKFNEKDKEQLIEFLNFIANKAEFNKLSTNEIIKYFRLLNFMQTQMLPKVDSNIMEIKRVIEAKDKEDLPELPKDLE